MLLLLEWILVKAEDLFDWLEWRLGLACRFGHVRPREGEVLAQFGCADLHVEVLDIELRGFPYAVHVIRCDRTGKWISDDKLTQSEAIVQMEALQEATQFISERWGPRRLPIVPLCGRRYFLDERLGELRNVVDPDDRLLFTTA